MKNHIARMKKNKNKNKEDSHKPFPWPNLPPQITTLLAIHPTLMYNITAFGCLALKSWRSPPKQCTKSRSPFLVEIDMKELRGRSHVVDIQFHEKFPYCYYKRRSYNNYFCPGRRFKGCTGGSVVVVGSNPCDLYFWNPAGQSNYNLSKWDSNIPFKTCVISSSIQKHCNGVLAITGMCSPAFGFYKWGEPWILRNCVVEEPYAPGQCMSFTNIVGHGGKVYALSLQGSVAVIEGVEITAIGANRAVPSGLSRQFREYLFEVDGEILLVLLVSRKSIDVVNDVEVLRLDVGKLLWVKVKSIGEKALFVEDECCMGVVARSVGCKKNCVYFTHHRTNVWWKFDMGNGHIEGASSRNGDGNQEFEKWEEPNLEME
ncbi:uncharacterized protein LOC127243902 [Andrographis paniculata]|uniref:uncharacterized protein LOC127243902 n=1 Tax=Andrographis paniculata TaxID=175694 RepID=UPI0021E7DFCA|nr:uncharacterized protein LOC127243902 [Andrographis paniculata]